MAVRSCYVQKGGSFLVFLYKTLEERAHTNDWAFPKETSRQLKLTLNYVIQKTFLFFPATSKTISTNLHTSGIFKVLIQSSAHINKTILFLPDFSIG